MEEISKKVQNELDKYHIPLKVITFDASTRTSKDAAKAIRCDLAQIAKTIIFSTTNNEPICIIVSGPNRVDEKLLEKTINKKIKKATPEFVKEQTGFEIGGVSPIAQKENIPIFIDQDLTNLETVWTAAGTAHSVFKIPSKDLIKITNAKIIKVK